MRASASSTCTPRLVDRSSCHSSTMIADRWAKRSRQSARARSSVRLSGVVTSAVGRRLFCRARADDAVSPVRTSTVQCGCNAARRARERQAGVRGERAQRRDPEDGQRRRSIGRAGRAQHQRWNPRRVCLAHAGGCVHESALAGGKGGPDLFLEGKRRPTLPEEPCAGGRERVALDRQVGDRGGHRHVLRGRWRFVAQRAHCPSM